VNCVTSDALAARFHKRSLILSIVRLEAHALSRSTISSRLDNAPGMQETADTSLTPLGLGHESEIVSMRRLQLMRDENVTIAVIIGTLCVFDAVVVWLLLAR
jgi:hypothetical protein